MERSFSGKRPVLTGSHLSPPFISQRVLKTILSPIGRRRIGTLSFALLVAITMAGCQSLVVSASKKLAEDVADAIMNQDDYETVRDGAPAFLLLIDGMISSNPENEHLLQAGAKLYGSYASAFADDPGRQQRLALKARRCANLALCSRDEKLCRVIDGPFDEFILTLDRSSERDVPALFTAASAWTTWIQVNSADWDAITDLPRVEAILKRVVKLEPGYERGMPYIYLGVLSTLRPPALGGKMEEGLYSFQRAIDLSRGKNLMAKALMAQHYARMIFDRELHDRLCNEVLDESPEEDGLTLINILAKRLALHLLNESEEYFGD